MILRKEENAIGMHTENYFIPLAATQLMEALGKVVKG